MKNVQASAEEMLWNQVTSGLHSIPMELIRSSPDNARKTFDPVKLQAFARQIEVEGQLAPVLCHPFESGDGALFQLFDGERRFRAMQLFGATHIDVKVSPISDLAEAHRKGLVANFAREDVNPIERGAGYWREMELGGHKSVEAMAAALGMHDEIRTIRNQMSLSKLIPEVREALVNGEISEAHAVLIARETNENQVKCLAWCFETETVTISALPETNTRLISEKALRGLIMSRLREPADDEKLAQKIAEKRVEAEVRSEKEKELEREGERLAGGSEMDSRKDAEDREGAKNGEETAIANNANERENGNGEEDEKIAASGTETDVEIAFQLLSEIMPKVKDNGFTKFEMSLIARQMMMCSRGIEDMAMEKYFGCDFGHRDKVIEHFEKQGELGLMRLIIAKMALDPRPSPKDEGWTYPNFKALHEGRVKDYGCNVDAIAKKAPVKKKKGKKADRYQQVGEMVDEAAKYIVDALELDPMDWDDMRKTGMTDDSICNLLEACFENETRDRDFAGFRLAFSKAHLELSELDGGAPFYDLCEDIYINAIRSALQVPNLIESTDKKPAKKKSKKPSKSKKK